MMNLIKNIGVVIGTMGAVIGAWVGIGGPLPATSQDIKRLDKSQTDAAVDLYSKEVRSNIILRGTVQEPTTRALIDESLREAQDKLKAAQDRKIELSK